MGANLLVSDFDDYEKNFDGDHYHYHYNFDNHYNFDDYNFDDDDNDNEDDDHNNFDDDYHDCQVAIHGEPLRGGKGSLQTWRQVLLLWRVCDIL